MAMVLFANSRWIKGFRCKISGKEFYYMRLRKLGTILGLSLGLLPCSALGKGAKSELLEVPIKLHSQEGCWHYFGDASVYVGTFSKGTYIGVSMVTIGPQGFPEPSDKE